MVPWRRASFDLSAGAFTGTALGGIARLGLSLAPTGGFYTGDGRGPAENM